MKPRLADSVTQFLRVAFATCLVAALCVPITAVRAADSQTVDRPRIGLVLGGGGAKGAAHIGVLTVLDELQVPIDCVVGTSMGALVGGTFASGMPPEEIETATRGINWEETVGSEGLRDRTPINRKLQGTTYTNSLELGVGNDGVSMPGGLLKTQEIEEVIRDLVNNARIKRDFDDLSIPFRAVATDMVTGDMVVMDSGDIAIAMRASMAVPGAFSPVVVDDMVLSDGGMVRNLPVDIARELCADVVIAVWLSSPLPKAEELDSALALVARSMAVMINANESAQIETLTSNDVGIDVPMGDIGTGDFQRVPDAIELGRAAAEAVADQLSRYAVPAEDYMAWREEISSPGEENVRVAAVRIEGLDHVNPDYVTANLQHIKPGAEVTGEQIREDIKGIYALGDFDKVDYRVAGQPDGRIIRITPVEKARGPNYLKFDFGLYAEGSGELQAILRGEHTRTWINQHGAEWYNILQVGRETIVSTSFYQPFDVTRRFFFRPTIAYDSDLEAIYNDGDRVARYYLNELYGELAIGMNIGSRAQLSTGLRRGWLQTRLDTGPSFLPETGKEDDTSVFINATYDTRDDIGLPTRGSLIYLNYMHANTWLGGTHQYDQIEGVVTKSFPWRDDSLSLIAGGGATLDGELPVVRDFRLGGIRSFPGLRLGELRGTSYWYAGSSYLWKLADIQPLLGQALYAGLRLQAGKVGGRRDHVNDGTLYGISGSLNGRTPIGPFTLSLGYVTNGAWELQFSLGRPLPEGSALDEIN